MTSANLIPDPYYADESVTLYHGDCIDVMRELPEASVDAVITDPPYGLGFMGKAWDADFINATIDRRRQYAGDPSGGENGGYRSAAVEAGRYDLSLKGNRVFGAWCQEWSTEALRILKPGGHLLAFGGTRTWHRLACAIEDAGFEVRDSIAWMYGSGFPKSLDVSKAIDKAAGAEREVPRSQSADGEGYDPKGRLTGRTSATQWCESCGKSRGSQLSNCRCDTTGAPTTPAAQQWQGWGTALKPAFEPIVVARKPLIGTVAANVLEHGTGALNVDGCRVSFASEADERESKEKNRHADFGSEVGGNEVYGDYSMVPRTNYNPPGRWPANVILDESQAAELDLQSGHQKDGKAVLQNRSREYNASSYMITDNREGDRGYGGEGGASRFFYTAKADSSERPRVNGIAHPTVKPLDLMRYLVRLVTPPGGVVLEPFAGSGTTLEAAVIEGFRAIGIERETDYLPLITHRLTKPLAPVMF